MNFLVSDKASSLYCISLGMTAFVACHSEGGTTEESVFE
jgi:hypothetical protein